MAEESNYNKRYFKFNLIPPLTKEELGTLEKRDNTLLYSFVLIFCGILIYFTSILVENFIVQPRLNSINKDILSIDQQISTYNRIKSINGELYLKTKSLEPILLNDIKISDLLNSVNEIIANNPNLNVLSYQRENLDTFVINVLGTNFDDAVKLIDLMQQSMSFTNVKLRNILQVNNNSSAFTISFSLVTNEN